MKTQVELAAAIREAEAADIAAGMKKGMAQRVGRCLDDSGLVANLPPGPPGDSQRAIDAYWENRRWWKEGYFGSIRVDMEALSKITAGRFSGFERAGPKVIRILAPFLAPSHAEPPPPLPPWDPDASVKQSPLESPWLTRPANVRVIEYLIDCVMERLDQVPEREERAALYRWNARLSGELAELLKEP